MRLLLITIIFLPTLYGYCGHIEGRIQEEISKEPVIFAPIALFKSDILVGNYESDFDGNFIISDIPVGKYQIKIKYDGFYDYSNNVDIYSNEIVKLTALMEVNEELPVPVVITRCFKLIETNTNCFAGPTSSKIERLPVKRIDVINTMNCEERKNNGNTISIGHGRCGCRMYYINNKIGNENPPMVEMKNDFSTNDGLLLYPNPAVSFINIKTAKSPSRIRLVSINGNFIKEIFPNDLDETIDISQLDKGGYIMEISFDTRCEKKVFVKM